MNLLEELSLNRNKIESIKQEYFTGLTCLKK